MENITIVLFFQDGDMLTFEFKTFFRRFTNDAIAISAFGVDVDSFKDLKNDFFISGEKAQEYNYIIQAKLALYMIIPAIMKVRSGLLNFEIWIIMKTL